MRLLARHAGAKKPLLLRRNGESGGVRRSERRLSAVGRQWRLSVRELLVAADERCGSGCRVLCHAARVLARAGARGDQPRFSRDRSQRRMAAEAVGESRGLRFRRTDASQLDASAVYGLPELHADAIKHAALLANPGCYSTSIILALAPWIRAGFVDVEHGIICDSKSGVSGAGKQPIAQDTFCGG